MLNKILIKIKNSLENYKRVLIVAKKPSKEDLKEIIKISLTILGIVGLLGFIFYTISILFIV
ncbi:MAG: protein translocase SEC61 complex subunit gamma [Candidatus Aenigmatarchaeota archaeon]